MTWHKIELSYTFRPKMGSCRVEHQRIMKTKKKDGSFLSAPVPVNFLCIYFVSPVTQSFRRYSFFTVLMHCSVHLKYFLILVSILSEKELTWADLDELSACVFHLTRIFSPFSSVIVSFHLTLLLCVLSSFQRFLLSPPQHSETHSESGSSWTQPHRRP